MGRIPVPLKYTFKDGLEAILKNYRIEKGIRLKCYFPMGGGSGYSLFQHIHEVDNIDDFPNIVLSSSFDNVFEKNFFGKFIDKGYFQACQPKPLPPIYAECGIEDPEKQFTIFAVVPIVFLVDHRRLGSLPVPGQWSDILDPIYHDKIIVGGWRKDEKSPYSEFNTFLFLNIYKDHGIQGLKHLAYNTKNMLHYVHMSRIAGSDNELGATIYIIPWFLADICPRGGKTSVIWPGYGALAFPFYILAKKAKLEELDALIKYTTGRKIVLVSTHDPLLALMGNRRIVIRNGAISNIIETSKQERANLEYMEFLDCKMTELRDMLRNGGRIDTELNWCSG
ncbi:Spermidine/putrescine-binding protein [Methanosarcina siciliae HI350]|uniref:Spermidine/putrescine-binding protein n=1 Tax=Methanosarcina siciliae HI350 TaxID=1434119 RepID=A0A0E3PGP4_9EURY|nr:ABC transporter substrate-binding protein [Methanosarcina siciliae]AKB33588.1 Spermidine/putrescine-binding protein [Methanosarcina siciliae HI350]